MSSIERFGVIGCGPFGNIAALHLAPPGVEVLVFDPNPDVQVPKNARRVGFSAVAAADVIILAVSFDAYGSVLPELADSADPNSLFVDVCSVKWKPEQAFKELDLLERPNVLMTHPLFGPQTAARGVKDKNLAVTLQKGDLAVQMLDVWRKKGISIVEISAMEHDLEMAPVHVLPFFIGDGLEKLGIQPSVLGTPYYNKLLALVDVEHLHSAALKDTIQRHNPFARAMREKLLTVLHELNDFYSDVDPSSRRQ